MIGLVTKGMIRRPIEVTNIVTIESASISVEFEDEMSV